MKWDEIEIGSRVYYWANKVEQAPLQKVPAYMQVSDVSKRSNGTFVNSGMLNVESLFPTAEAALAQRAKELRVFANDCLERSIEWTMEAEHGMNVKVAATQVAAGLLRAAA